MKKVYILYLLICCSICIGLRLRPVLGGFEASDDCCCNFVASNSSNHWHQQMQIAQLRGINQQFGTAYVGVIDSGVNRWGTYLYGRLCIPNTPNIKSRNFNPNGSSWYDDTWKNHGTPIARIIAGQHDIGISPHSRIVSLRIGRFDAPAQMVYDAIIHATTFPEIRILNLSIYRGIINMNILRAINNFPGIVVWSAGNDTSNINNFLPFNINSKMRPDNLIVVGSMDYNYNRTSNSNFGNFTVDLFARGSHIQTLTLASDEGSMVGGTSFAVPMVSGLVALMLTVNPHLTNQQIINALKTTVNQNVPNCVRLNSIWGGALSPYAALLHIVSLLPPPPVCDCRNCPFTDTRCICGWCTCHSIFKEKTYDY